MLSNEAACFQCWAVLLRLAVAIRLGSWVLGLIGVSSSTRPERGEFVRFVDEVEPRLLQALVAVYGPVDGRGATVDALSWAWEHWDRLQEIENRSAYLFRVGQSATRRYSVRPLPTRYRVEGLVEDREIEPGLLPALERLSDQQRTVVVLVHAFGWRQTEVAEWLEISVSTAREHLARGLRRLRGDLEVRDVS